MSGILYNCNFFIHIFHLNSLIISAAKDLIENLLIVDRRRRYKSIDVLTHPWIVTLANTLESPTNMSEYRLNLRMELDTQAKMAWDSYRLQYHV
jgi:serine/threonine protein kinase